MISKSNKTYEKQHHNKLLLCFNPKTKPNKPKDNCNFKQDDSEKIKRGKENSMLNLVLANNQEEMKEPKPRNSMLRINKNGSNQKDKKAEKGKMHSMLNLVLAYNFREQKEQKDNDGFNQERE